MDDKNRTKVLAGLLAVVLGFGLLRPDKLLLNPIHEAERKRANAKLSYEDESAKQDLLMRALGRIQSSRNTSLPPRASDAHRLYQSWVTNLAEQCKFAQLQVTPGNPRSVRGQYLTVEVKLEAETDLPGLSRFLYHFKQADLMHRVNSLDIRSTGASGNPRMEITLVAEGMSVAGSSPSSDVFARTSLPTPLTSSATELTVAEGADFPRKTPFLAQIGREMVKVTAHDGNKWTVQRGQEGTAAVDHAADQVVQLFRVSPARASLSFADYDEFLKASPFLKPAAPKTYRPRLASISDKTIEPGEAVEMTAKAEDINPDVGAPVFALEDASDGMTIDPETGLFEWSTSKELELKRYEPTFILTQKNNPDLRIEKKIGITLKLPNEAPTVSLPESAIVVLGRDFSMQPEADDDLGTEALKFSLEGDVPQGLTIDESAGTLKWTPAKTFAPGEYNITVQVTDGEKSASDSVSLNVQDDDAILTKLTGSVTLDGDPIAWFRNMAKKSRPRLRVGDRIVAAEIDATLAEISKRYVLLADAEGVWKLELGDSLRDRVLIEPAQPKADDDTDNGQSAQPAKDSDAAADAAPPAATGQPIPAPASAAADNKDVPAAADDADSVSGKAEAEEEAPADSDATLPIPAEAPPAADPVEK